MAFFRPTVHFFVQIWYAIDTINAIRHSVPMSEHAPKYIMTSGRSTSSESAQAPAATGTEPALV